MFRGLTIYQITQSTKGVVERLTAALGDDKFAFRPPGKHDAHSSGFVEPLGPDSEGRMYEVDKAILFCLRRDEKVVPPSAVREQVDAIIRDKESGGEEVSKTDARLIKEGVIADMLPTAIAAPRYTFAFLDKTMGMLFISASEADSDVFMEYMKKALGGTPFITLGLHDDDPCRFFTEWLQDPSKLGSTFRLGDACSLKQAKEKGTAILNISHEDLQASDLLALLKAGKTCCRIALEHDAMSFAVTAKLGLRRMSLSDDSKAELAENEEPEPSAQRANEFAMSVAIVRQVLRELEALMGGWPEQTKLDL